MAAKGWWTGLIPLVVGALLSAAVSHAAAPPVMDPQLARATDRLEQRTDADSLSTAGLLRFFSAPEPALLLATRAVAAAPQRPELVWLAMSLCQAHPGCPSASWEQQLAAADPGNAAPHLVALQRATAAGDGAAEEAALAAIAASERLDFYWTKLIADATRTLNGLVPLRAAEMSVVGTLTGVMPPFAPLSHACQTEGLQRPGGRERCQRIAAVLQRGDTVIAEMVGVAIAKRAWPQSTPGWQDADTARRVYDYRTGILAKEPLWAPRHAAQYRALLESSPREQDLMRQQIILLRQPPDPPAP